MQPDVEYKPLKPDSGFRLITLQPSSDFSSPIKCELHNVELHNHPSFEALSYVWGQTTETRPIQVGRGMFNATRNLETALRHLRLPDRPRQIWADAICIDQANHAEKSNHIGYMSQVYQRCATDLLWLGEDAKMLQDAASSMAHFGSLFRLEDELRQRWLDLSDEQTQTLERMQENLRHLFATPAVWRRVWIVQEVAFASSLLLVAGHATLPWTVVEDFLDVDVYIERYGVPDAFHGPFSHDMSIRSWASGAIAYPQIMCHQRRVVRDAVQANEPSSMLDVLSRFRYTDATDPRDKIYALLSLTSNKLDIKVDYSLSTRAIYIDCMKRLMEHDRNLDLLCQSAWQLYGNDSRSSDLPSWTIDFASPGQTSILFAQRSIFNAGGAEVDLPLAVSEGTLQLAGYEIDTLSHVSRCSQQNQHAVPYPPGANHCLQWMPDDLILAAIRNGNSSLSSFLKTNHPDASACDVPNFPASFEAFWRTMMMDVKRYPMARLTSADIEELAPRFTKWITTPLDSNRDIDIDFRVQDAVFEWYTWDFAVTKGGIYCRLPHGAQDGDWITVLKGAKVPVVLRPVPSGDGGANEANSDFLFVGPCYVHGFMDGQVFEKSRGFEERTFCII
ncbi:heterokaryon incompatibility protein [Metarhizium robertsii]|uniref:Het domain containing protein n=2 Tax=Metarhizium robertsii TaxID=568076 RepID=E9ET66_METRA|nr:het domain containing protein [Metarhizium robertsii ARSEF 23]EFZ01831.1 het domain containing protein [Metarhizium robertsii ARSEF 23]EXV02322.1 heterokaryon incompatibility protein [Metarhizium robertsii]